MKKKPIFIGAGIVIVCALIPVLVASTLSGKGRKDFDIKARQYAYNPPRITVNKGDEVHIRLASLDVVHGFFLEGHDIDAVIEPGKSTFKMRHPSQGREFIEVEEIVFTAGPPGKYRFRCSHTCGTLHPFMLGEFIVRPNYPFIASVGGAGGIVISVFVMLALSSKNNRQPQHKEAPNDAA